MPSDPGQTIVLYFNVHQDGYGDLTSMLLDDVTISRPALTLSQSVNVAEGDNLTGQGLTISASSAGGRQPRRWGKTSEGDRRGAERWEFIITAWFVDGNGSSPRKPRRDRRGREIPSRARHSR